MTIQKLQELVKKIDRHYEKVRTSEECKTEIGMYASEFKNVPDEILEITMYQAFMKAAWYAGFPVEWKKAVDRIQESKEPSTTEMWLQAKRTAKKISDNTYYARTGGIILAPGKKKTPMELYRENDDLFHALPKPIQNWAGSADMLADCVLRSDAEQFIKPGFEKAMREARLTATIGQLDSGSATIALNE